MKVIKRDGKIVDYDRTRIEIAIEKANAEVREKERATKEQIEMIITHIEELDKKRILVEDIQDMIEKELMSLGKYELAKKYMIYRYTRALARKQNTTDELILGSIRNNDKELTDENLNRNIMLASTQRDYIAGEVSKDLTKRILLPEKINKAHDDGVFFFNDYEYFVQPIFNSSLINIEDMLDNGTVINGRMIEEPNSFEVACIVMTQIIASCASNQYGELSVDISALGKYLRKSRKKFEREIEDSVGKRVTKTVISDLVDDRLEKELSSGVQTIQYQVNTLTTTNGEQPCVTLFLNLKDDEYIYENAMIIEEILKQRYKGIKNEKGEYVTAVYPKLIYVLYDYNSLNGGEYDYLTKLAIKCSSKRIYPNYISAKKMQENYEGNVYSPMGCMNFLNSWKDEDGKFKFQGRFNQGMVSINLVQIALESGNDEDKFWGLLDERLELCKDALMYRYYALKGTLSDTSPIHWQNGAIARLHKGEKIDKYLQGGYSNLLLGYIGLYETTKLMTGESHVTPVGHDFAIKLINVINESINKWKKETGIEFLLCGAVDESLCYRFARIDKEKYGTIEGITDKEYYTNSFHVSQNEGLSIYEKLEFESEFQELSLGGAISYVDITSISENLSELENIIKFMYVNNQYIEFTNKTECCEVCGYSGEVVINKDYKWECPNCGKIQLREVGL